MAETATATTNRRVWVDLGAKDPAAAQDFYSKLFGWTVEINPDPQYGGYGRAQIGGKDAAGIGETQSPDQPSAWSLYIGTYDADALARKVVEAGGTVAAPPFDVGDQGRMAVFKDPSGAFISAWQTTNMGGFQAQGPNSFGWADLNAHGVELVLPFYQEVFGWTIKPSGSPEQPYTEFEVGGESIGGAAEMDPNLPAGTPNYWLVYFTVPDVDAAHRSAVSGGGRQIVAPFDFPGGRMSIVSDPEGAAFGLMKLSEG